MARIRRLLIVALLVAVGGAAARPLAPAAVPEPLRPWIPWVMHGDEERICAFAFDDHGVRRCAWPTTLDLDLGDAYGRFDAVWRVHAPSWITLPGDARHWPQQVTVNGDAALVTERQGRPATRLEPGSHRITGAFFWDRLPEDFRIPPDTALVRLSVNHARVEHPDIGEHGRLWLKTTAPGAVEREADRLGLLVFRRVVDEVPLRVSTQVDLEVAGQPRETVLASPLLEGFIPLSVDSPIPARLEPDGGLRLRLGPGRWSIRLDARAPDERRALALAARAAPWPATEVWVFEARNHIRLVEVAGVPAVDPRQTQLPPDWRQLPAYRVAAGASMVFNVIRRGDPEPEPDKLELARNLWLDFDGGGYTINDVIRGSMTRGWRLEAGDGLALGRVLLDGEPQFITTRASSERSGVEVRRGAVDLSADSRWQGPIRALPAVGWEHDFQRLEAVLNLPPGWSLFASSGIDRVSESWIQRWSLLDLFLVLVAALATSRLWGWRPGVLALATLVLTWHEPGAPRIVWLHLLVAVALLRVLPSGTFAFLVTAYRNMSLLVLVAIALPFLADEVLTGLYPQLEQPWRTAGQAVAGRQDTALAERTRALAEAPAPIAADQRPAGIEPKVAAERLEEHPAAAEAPSVPGAAGRPVERGPAAPAVAMVDPAARLQTGPGLPRWQWTSVPLSWNGPVERGQTMRLWLLSPGFNLMLAGVRVGLLAALVALLFVALRGPRPPAARAAAAALILAAPLAVWSPAPARADFPSPDLLDQLRQRLTEPPECLPACAQIPRLDLHVDPDTMVIRFEALATEDVAIPLPGHARHWLPASVTVDGQAADSLFRAEGEILWLLLGAGRREVALAGPVPGRPSLDLPLPLRPRYVEVDARGWRVDGVHDDGRADDQLKLTRIGGAGAAPAASAALEPAVLPAFVRIERTLRLGLDWRVETRVVRVSPPGAAVVIAVPLIAGESVTTPDVPVEDGAVRVNMAGRDTVMGWGSALEIRPEIRLTAPQTTAWTEVWRADVSPIWHVVPAGLAVVHHQDPGGRWLPEWRPWPGETVTLSVSRPEGVAGRTMTIDESRAHVRPGRRATDTDLELSLRSSRGGRHTMSLPEKARLQAVTIDGVAQPIRQNGREVTLPLEPGSRQVGLSWREPRGMTTSFRSAGIELGAPSVNASVQMTLGQDRWVWWTGGPRLGPAVLFWAALVVVAIAAAALSWTRLTPLAWGAWLLLGVGLTQVPVWSALIVVGWLLALGWRARLAADTPKRVFNLIQIGLVLLTLAALGVLFQAIQRGLLGLPEMQIGGNGSSAYDLRWYQDRAEDTLPATRVVSLPLMSYRLLMLAWALWLAFALLGWLRWGWACFSRGSLWKPFRVRARKQAT